MKITNGAAIMLDSHGVQKQTEFTIKATAKSFHLLSSGLYSDKISAVIREIGCNAVDAHIDANCPNRPIEIKLPARLDSEFYIKDFGKGLSPDDVESLYTIYFASTKADSNDQTGAFGLGSKSPFSYTDSFAITVVHEGVQRSYSAYTNNEGAPKIALLDERPATPDWTSGVMVSFPVKPNDIAEFHKKAEEVFAWFKVKPLWPGEDKSRYGLVTGKELPPKGKTFSFYSEDPIKRETYRELPCKARAIMGNVAYPLVADQMEGLSDAAKALIEAGIQLYLPMGSIMPTASREAIEYNPDTRACLQTTLKTVALEVAKELITRVALDKDGEWDQRARARAFGKEIPKPILDKVLAFMRELPMSADEQNRLASFFKDTRRLLPKWAGKDVYVDAVLNGGRPKADVLKSFKVGLCSWNSLALRMRKRAVVNGSIKRGRSESPAEVNYEGQVEVIYVDGKNGYERIAQRIAANQQLVVIMVQAAYAGGTSGAGEFAKRLATAVGKSECIATSSLEFRAQKRLAALSGAQSTGTKLKPAEREAIYAEENVFFVDTSTSKFVHRNDMEFQEIKKTAQYYLPAPDRSPGLAYTVKTEGMSRAVMIPEDKVDELVAAFKALHAQGLPVPDISGYMLPKGPQARKFRLVEKGWKPLLDTIVTTLLEPEVLEAIKTNLNKLPNLEFDAKGKQDRWSRMYKQAGLLGHLLEAAVSNTDFKTWLFKLLPEVPALEKEFLPLWDANVLGDNKCFDMPVQCLSTLLQNTVSKLQLERMEARVFCKSLLEQYPETRFIDAGNINQLWKEDIDGLERLLKLIFNLPRSTVL